MRYILLIFILFFSGCNQSDTTHNKVGVFGVKENGEQFLSYITNSKQKEKELKQTLDVKKMEINAKIEVEKIKAQKAVQVAKIKSTTSKDIAKTDSNTKIATTKLDVEALKEKSKMMLYAAAAFALVLIIGIIVLYLNFKKNRELKEKLHEREMEQREREREEKRLHKMLDLISDGKIPKELEKEVLINMTKSNRKLLEQFNLKIKIDIKNPFLFRMGFLLLKCIVFNSINRLFLK